ncbi:MAG: preprotein translocase subunit SecA [Verrucomicrobiota bacterium]
MKLSALNRQYDRLSFLQGAARQRWDGLFARKIAKSDEARLQDINALQDQARALTDEKIRAWANQLRHQIESGELDIHEVIEWGFALLRETSRRTTGLFHYDSQILGGLALVRGGVAEMATGEGKTLAVSLPAFIFSLAGEGVHVVTVNSYLAERDYEFSKPIFDFLGISIAHLPEGKDATPEGKRAAYAADITYGVGYEFGFDYMKDQLAIMRHPRSGPGDELRYAILGQEMPKPDTAQRGLSYAIIDEVDSVLIDEAGSPLLISEAGSQIAGFEAAFIKARDLAASLVEYEHFTVDINLKRVDLSSLGRREIFSDRKGVPWEVLRRPWETYVLNALKAQYLFHLDEHYVIDEGAIVIVDEFTGRPFPDRSWREGLHQAVAAFEDCEVQPEGDSAASITRQRFYALYDRICGLTGTAAESAGEFWKFFKMPVIPIALHKPSRRAIELERIFISRETRDRAVAIQIAERHRQGQPVLVGTRTIRESESLAALLVEAQIPHLVLTAKQDKDEEAIIEGAGEVGSVLIATNMAGRGTHIGLTDQAKAIGGLHVIQVERNESVRIDRQLIGRGARQGQPGSAQSFVSAEDYLIEFYAPEVGKRLKQMKPDGEGELSNSASRLFDQVQAKVERARYETRLRMAEHDKWLEETKESLAR